MSVSRIRTENNQYDPFVPMRYLLGSLHLILVFDLDRFACALLTALRACKFRSVSSLADVGCRYALSQFYIKTHYAAARNCFFS